MQDKNMVSNNVIQGYPKPLKDYYKVYVRSITYNQAPYIEDCLNGVAMQKTDFPFIHHVIDDCSTDGEQDVIKTWIKRECDNAEYYDNDLCTITFAKHKTNPQYTIVAYFLKRNMYRERAEKEKLYTPWCEVCPYIALCEGDDYWIDQLKLQKQVNILDKNNDYACVYTATYKLRGCKYIGTVESSVCDFESLLKRNVIPTQTTMIRSDIYSEYQKFVQPENKNWQMADYPLWLYISGKYKIRYLPDITSVYRILDESASHFISYDKQEKFLKSKYNIASYIIRLLQNTIDEQQKYLQIAYITNVLSLIDTQVKFRLFFTATKTFINNFTKLPFKYKIKEPIKIFCYSSRLKKIKHYIL